MDQCDFKVFTGVDNQIEFQIRDLDRRPVSIGQDVLEVVFADRHSRTVLLRQALTPQDPTRGIFLLTLQESVTQDWSEGTLAWTVVRVRQNHTTLLYTDEYQNPRGLAQVQPSLLDVPQITDPTRYDFPGVSRQAASSFEVTLPESFDAARLLSSDFQMQIRTSTSTASTILDCQVRPFMDGGLAKLEVKFGPFKEWKDLSALHHEITYTRDGDGQLIFQGTIPLTA